MRLPGFDREVVKLHRTVNGSKVKGPVYGKLTVVQVCQLDGGLFRIGKAQPKSNLDFLSGVERDLFSEADNRIRYISLESL